MGLLMNHLSVDGKGRVVFDAGDAMADEEEEEVELEEDPLVDLGKLRGERMRTLTKTYLTFSVHADAEQNDGPANLRYSILFPLLL